MPQTKAQQEKNNFVGGLITEASSLTFPPNASVFEQNFELRRDGTRRRRLGLEPEASVPTEFTTGATNNPVRFQTFLWERAGNTSRSLMVYVLGKSILFQYADNGTVDQPFSVGYFLLEDDAFDLVMSTSQGNLIVPSGGNYVNVVSFNGSSISVEQKSLSVRDIWGVEDFLAVDARPAPGANNIVAAVTHEYNLKNQGWVWDQADGDGDSEILISGRHPSNADIMWYGRETDGTFDFSLLNTSGTGTTPAPKGKFIIDAFQRSINRDSKVSRLMPTDSTQFSLRSAASYAGRMFYAGRVLEEFGFSQATSPRYDSTVFFTQTLQDSGDYGRCYQEADPTAEDTVGLLPSDGGTIVISECDVILGLFAVGSALVVFGGNGVWSITGTSGGVFAADAYDVIKVSDVGTIAVESVLVLEQEVVYWADSGIYVLSPDPTSGRLGIRNLTENTIQSYYLGLPSLSRSRVVGYYDKRNRVLRYLHNENDPHPDAHNDYSTELIYDMSLQAFSLFRFQRTNQMFDSTSDDHGFPVQYLPLPDVRFNEVDEPVTLLNGTTPVTLSDNTTPVTVEELRPDSQNRGHKYLMHVRSTEAFGVKAMTAVVADYTNENFEDYSENLDNTDAEAILITGQDTFGETQRRKMVPTLTLHYKRTETGFTEVSPGQLEAVGESSSLVSARWDFANDPVSGKFGREFQGYRLRRPYIPSGPNDDFNYGWEIITTKNKLRGTGRALALQFRTEPGKDCHIMGWALDVTGETVV